MATIQQDLNDIRQAIYGRDVREAIADGIEQCYSDVQNGVTVAEGKVAAMTASATKLAAGANPTATMNEVNGHKNLVLGIPKGDKGDKGDQGIQGVQGLKGDKGDKGEKGDPFGIKKTFASVSAMNAYTGSDVAVGDFVIISSDTEDVDNSKVYVKTSSGFSFVTDLSGAQGIKGEKGDTGAIPQIRIGTVTEVPYTGTTSASISQNGTDVVLNLGLKTGASGNESIRDTAGIGNSDVVWSADKTAKELAAKSDLDGTTSAKTALGNPIRIDDAVMAPLDKLTVKLEPKQDLHGYSKPWVGGAGKNLIPYVEAGSIDQTTGAEIDSTEVTRSGFIKVTPGETYTISGLSAVYNIRLFEYKENKVYDSTFPTTASALTHTVTFKSTTEWVRFQLLNAGASETMQFEKGSTATAYEPYENICPISGWDEIAVRRHSRNLIDFDKVTKDRYVSDTGTVSYSSGGLGVTDCIPVESGKTYQLMIVSAGSPVLSTRAISAFDSGNNFISPRLWAETVPADTAVDKIVDIEVPDNVAYLRINYYYNHDTVVFAEKAAVYRVSLSAAGGSVYGGNLVLNRDGSGTVTVDRGITDLGSLDWSYAETYSGKNVRWMSSIGLQAVVKRPAANTQKANAIFTAYENLPRDTVFNNVETNGVGTINSAGNVVIRDLSYSDSAEFKTAVNGQKVVYELATPQTFQLTAAQVKTLTGLNHISCDSGEMEIVYRADKYAEKTDFLATLPRLTASGNPITLTNGADGTPLKRLSIRIDPKQAGSGTPSPSNVRPISGWDGVNVWRHGKNLANPNECIASANMESNGVVAVSSSNAQYRLFVIRVMEGTTYVVSGDAINASGICIGYFTTKPAAGSRAYDNSRYVLSGQKYFTAPITGWACVRAGTTDTNVQIEIGSTSTTYEPYAGFDEFPIPFPPSIGTVYGANLVLEQDGSGTLTVDKAIKKLKDIAWEYQANYHRFYASVNGIKTASTTRTDVGLMATCYQTIDDERSVGDTPDLSIFNISLGIGVVIFDSQYNDNLSGFLAARGDTDIVYSLATPIVYYLTAPMVRTLLGYNNLISDAGTMEIEYHADPKMYADGSKVEINDNATGTYTDTGVVWSANRTRREANRKIPKVNPAFIGGIAGGLVEEEWHENKFYSTGTLVSVTEYAVDPDSGSTSPDLSIVTIYKAKKDSYNVEPSEDQTAWLEAFTLSLADYQNYQSNHDGAKAEYISNKTPIRTLDWAGNETLAGKLTAAGNIKTEGSIVIGSTVLSETKLRSLLALLET